MEMYVLIIIGCLLMFMAGAMVFILGFYSGFKLGGFKHLLEVKSWIDEVEKRDAIKKAVTKPAPKEAQNAANNSRT